MGNSQFFPQRENSQRTDSTCAIFFLQRVFFWFPSRSRLFFFFSQRVKRKATLHASTAVKIESRNQRRSRFFSLSSLFFFFVSVAKLTNVKLRNEAHGCRCSTEFNFISEFALCTCYTLVGRH